MIAIYDRDKLIANVDLVDGKLSVTSFADWASDFVEELRGDRTDEELFNSLTKRLRGYVWAGEVAKAG